MNYYCETWISKCEEAGLGESEKKYIDNIITFLKTSYFDSKRNKKLHFRGETLVILLASLNTITTALISQAGQFSKQCTILAFIISTLVTTLTTYINLRKPKETWMRHSAYFLMLNAETQRFCSGVLNYEGLSTAEAIKLYKSNTIILQDINYKNFFTNMGYVEFYSSLSKSDTQMKENNE